jgi:hypothetical protein
MTKDQRDEMTVSLALFMEPSTASWGERFTLEFMVVLLFVGAFMSLGATFWLPPFVLIIVVHVGVVVWFYHLRTFNFNRFDLRFLMIPAAILLIDIWSSFPSVPPYYDRAYHLQISNRILDRWTWEPYHQGIPYSFRPELMSGIAAVELAWSGETYIVRSTPFLALVGTAWMLQHLSEQITTKARALFPPTIFLLFPIVLEFGRTMLLDVLIVGSLLCVVVFWIKQDEDSTPRSWFKIGLIAGCCGLVKYPYFYIGPWLGILLLYERTRLETKLVLAGWSVPTLLFLIRNTINQQDPLGPMNSQITGTYLSATSEYGLYTIDVFIEDFIAQWPVALFIFALLGTILIQKEHRPILFKTWVLLLPAFVLFAFVLDFGWVRYSTPWLALLSLGIPSMMQSHRLFHERLQSKAVVAVGAVVMLCMLSMTQAMMTDENLGGVSGVDVLKRSQDHAELFVGVGDVLPDGSILLAGNDITVGLYATNEAYRFGPSTDPVADSILVVDGTHVFTHTSMNRFSFELNWTYLLGSPMTPLADVSTENVNGYVWEVDPSRLDERRWWLENPGAVNGTGGQSADMVWLGEEATFSWPDNTAPHLIVRYDGPLPNAGVFNALLSEEHPDVLCRTLESCSELERSTHYDEQWLMWGVLA